MSTPDRMTALEIATDAALKELDLAGASRASAIRQRLEDTAQWIETSLDADKTRRADITAARSAWGHRPREED